MYFLCKAARRGILRFQNSYGDDLVENLRRDGCSRQPQPFHEFSRRHGALKSAEHTPVFRHSRLIKYENVAHLDIQVVQARDFGDMRDLSCAVAETRGLHQQMNNRGHLLAHEAAAQIELRNSDNRLMPTEGLGWTICYV